MEVFLAIITIIFIMVFIIAYSNSKDLKDRGVISTISVTHIEGIPTVNEGQQVTLFLYNDKLTINDQQIIPSDRIENIKISTEKEITEKERSVIGRSIVGGLILGPVGAVIGGLSGVKNKKVNLEKYFLIVKYLNRDKQPSRAIFVTEEKLRIALFRSALSKIGLISEEPNTEVGEI